MLHSFLLSEDWIYRRTNLEDFDRVKNTTTNNNTLTPMSPPMEQPAGGPAGGGPLPAHVGGGPLPGPASAEKRKEVAAAGAEPAAKKAKKDKKKDDESDQDKKKTKKHKKGKKDDDSDEEESEGSDESDEDESDGEHEDSDDEEEEDDEDAEPLPKKSAKGDKAATKKKLKRNPSTGSDDTPPGGKPTTVGTQKAMARTIITMIAPVKTPLKHLVTVTFKKPRDLKKVTEHAQKKAKHFLKQVEEIETRWTKAQTSTRVMKGMTKVSVADKKIVIQLHVHPILIWVMCATVETYINVYVVLHARVCVCVCVIMRMSLPRRRRPQPALKMSRTCSRSARARRSGEAMLKSGVH